MGDIQYIVGLDEAGCGALAGPLVVAAVAFKVDAVKVTAPWITVRGPQKTLAVADSKKVKDPHQRAVLAEAVRQQCVTFSIVERSPREIDERLMRTVFPEAVQLAASRCLETLHTGRPWLQPTDVLLLVDGDIERPRVPCPLRMIPGGDATHWQISAASILAKNKHDAYVDKMCRDYPRWDFDKHRGYPTPAHKDLLRKRGLIEDVHRKSFGPVRTSRGPIPGFEE